MDETDRIDYIETYRQIMFDFHGKYTFLFDGTKISLFVTEQLYNLSSHPITGKKLSASELQYIKFHYDCYQYTKDMELTHDRLSDFFIWYDESRKIGKTIPDLRLAPETAQAFKIVEFYLTATDFQSHFKEFNPADSEQEKYERDLAEKALREGAINGSWLLRHSSKNRPVTNEAMEKLRIAGIRYYALSHINKDEQIEHILIEHAVGLGWQYGRFAFPCFLHCVEYILNASDIPYNKRISRYTTTEPDII